VVSMRRPFAGSDLVYDTAGPPARGDRASSGTISTVTALYSVDGDQVHDVSGRQPGPASGDEYLGVDVRQLVARRIALDTSRQRSLAGRRCHVYRFVDPPSGPIARVPDGADHADLCLDASGLVLSTVWTYHGEVVTDREAIDVRTSARALASDSSPDEPSVDGASPPPAAAASATPQSAPVSFLATPPAPSGYRRVVAPVVFHLPDPHAPTTLAASSVVWSFAAGGRYVTVEAGFERGDRVPWRPDDTVTRRVHLRVGAATTALRSDGAEVRVDLGRGRWIRVRGSIPVADLVTYARHLRLA